MQKKPLWAPWRMQYLKEPRKLQKGECLFCTLLKEDNDRENLIVNREKEVFLILNKYPYNNGHVMVVPNQHTGEFNELSESAQGAMMKLVNKTVLALKSLYNPDGFNIGMNIGIAGGAGVPGHLHMHIVPRWVGDTNFLPLLSDTKSLPQHLEASFDQISEHFQRIAS